jgi:hypothetical protein
VLIAQPAAPAAYRALMGAMIALLVAIAMIVTATQARAQTAPPSFADLVDQVGDAVVNITTSAVVASRQGPAPNVPPGSPLEDFFNDFLDRQQGPENAPAPQPGAGLGLRDLRGWLHRHQQPRDRRRRRDPDRVPSGHRARGRTDRHRSQHRHRAPEGRATRRCPSCPSATATRCPRGRLGDGHGQPARPGLLGVGRVVSARERALSRHL